MISALEVAADSSLSCSPLPIFRHSFGSEAPRCTFEPPHACVRVTACAFTRSLVCSQEREEVVDRELRLREDVRERRALDRPVRGDGDLERLVVAVLLQADVTPPAVARRPNRP